MALYLESRDSNGNLKFRIKAKNGKFVEFDQFDLTISEAQSLARLSSRSSLQDRPFVLRIG